VLAVFPARDPASTDVSPSVAEAQAPPSEEAVITALSAFRATRRTRVDEEEDFLRDAYGEALIGVRGGVRGHVIRCRQASRGKAGRPSKTPKQQTR
jgi:hypothetical protein